MAENLQKLLYRSFDEILSSKEKMQLDQALSTDDKLRQEREKIILLRETIKQGGSATFKPYFADRIIGRIKSLTTNREEEFFFESLFSFFRPVVIATVLLLIILTGYNFASKGKVSFEDVLGVPEVTLDDAYDTSLAVVLEESNEN